MKKVIYHYFKHICYSNWFYVSNNCTELFLTWFILFFVEMFVLLYYIIKSAKISRIVIFMYSYFSYIKEVFFIYFSIWKNERDSKENISISNLIAIYSSRYIHTQKSNKSFAGLLFSESARLRVFVASPMFSLFLFFVSHTTNK